MSQICGILIESENFNGLEVDIVYYPASGGNIFLQSSKLNSAPVKCGLSSPPLMFLAHIGQLALHASVISK